MQLQAVYICWSFPAGTSGREGNGAVRLPWPAVGRPPPRPKALMKRGSRDRGVEGRGWEGRPATTCTASRCVYGVLGVGTSSLLQAALSFRRRSWPTFTLGAKWHRPCFDHVPATYTMILVLNGIFVFHLKQSFFLNLNEEVITTIHMLYSIYNYP